MKKLFIILLSVLSLTAFAQNDVKRVAILETVDKEDKVNYGMELMLRAALSDAVTRTPGYEGYDRVDLKSITGEQSFQRTGMVSDSDIKKIGVMTGAQFVLVAEAAQLDQSHIIITAKILDVETARLTNTAFEMMGTASDEMKEGCGKLAAALLGVSIAGGGKGGSSGYSHQVPDGYVDLGLPSGTLWKAENENCGLITYDQAVNFYGPSLPTSEQWEELQTNCLWTWTGNGYKVKGRNGESLFLSAEGCRDCNGSVDEVGLGFYRSRSPHPYDPTKYVWTIIFHSSMVFMDGRDPCLGQSVRLVR